ncbi:MAG: hypothetical protein Q8P12_04115 [bacterium]|nr:hypothetical protein [bacterium]
MNNQGKLKEMGCGEWIEVPAKEDGGEPTRVWKGVEKYYYLNFGPRTGRAVVCVIPSTMPTGYARGVSFCHWKDLNRFSKKKGRDAALGRAVGAMMRPGVKSPKEPIPMKGPASFLRVRQFGMDHGWTHLSAWGVELTDFEKKLFKVEAEKVTG